MARVRKSQGVADSKAKTHQVSAELQNNLKRKQRTGETFNL